jgi:hypothetical protein
MCALDGPNDPRRHVWHDLSDHMPRDAPELGSWLGLWCGLGRRGVGELAGNLGTQVPLIIGEPVEVGIERHDAFSAAVE